MKISVLTLGCKVNQYESGGIAKHLNGLGHETSETLDVADIYIINTCAVTHDAEKKSRQLITKCKKKNENAKIIVMGCAVQNKTEQFEGKGGVSYLLGNSKKDMAVAEVEKIALSNGEAPDFEKIEETFNLPMEFQDEFAKANHKTRAFLKVQDGCNNFCSYCIIPYLRGRSRSRSVESVVAEMQKLRDVNEVVLVGINLSDFSGSLGMLAKGVEKVGIRYRFGSLEAGVITDEFLQILQESKNFCPQFHLSLQSGEDETLRAMNRKYTTKEYSEKAELIRKYFPNAGITTDIIVGFPTETDEHFRKTVNFAKEIAFSDIHIFPYSVRTGTVASKKYADLDGEKKTKRKNEMSQVKQELVENFLKKQIGKTLELLVEEPEGDYMVGHSRNFVKCYLQEADANKIYRVVAKSIHNDGLMCEIKE